MRRKRIVKQIGCAVLAGALMVGQIFGSGASLITAKAAESWVDTLKVANGDFETGDSSNWTIESGSGAELVVKNGGSNVNSTYYLNIWASDAADVSITQTVEAVPAGTYKLEYDVEGDAQDTGLTVSVADKSQAVGATTGWDAWATNETEEFVLEDTTDVSISFKGSLAKEYWGKIDNVKLCKLDCLASICSIRCRCSGNLNTRIRCTVQDHNTLICTLSKNHPCMSVIVSDISRIQFPAGA